MKSNPLPPKPILKGTAVRKILLRVKRVFELRLAVLVDESKDYWNSLVRSFWFHLFSIVALIGFWALVNVGLILAAHDLLGFSYWLGCLALGAINLTLAVVWFLAAQKALSKSAFPITKNAVKETMSLFL